MTEEEMMRKEEAGTRKGSIKSKYSKMSEADLYGYSCPRELEEMQPEREPLTIDDSGLNPEMAEAMRPLLDVARSNLWHWKTFPILLPQPITAHADSSGGASLARRKTIQVRDLFVEPNFNELEAVALDSKGEPKPLTSSQLESLRRTGEFQVESGQFAGQQHTWRVSSLLQLGTERSTQAMRAHLSQAVKLLVITARDRLLGDYFSLKESINGWSVGGLSLLDILIGLPSMQTVNLELRLEEERSAYLVCELVSPLPEGLQDIAHFIRRMIRNSLEKGGSMKQEKVPAITFIYQTPQGQEIDLRLCSSEVVSKARPILLRILEAESQGWFASFREKTISELTCKYSTSDRIEAEANRRISSEYLRRVSTAVLGDESLAAIGQGLPRLLIDQLRASLLAQQSLHAVEEARGQALQAEEQRLQAAHPIRSQISTWMGRRLAEFQARHIEAHQWAAHTAAITACKEAGLFQHAYFLNRDLSFLQDQEPVLRAELAENLRSPRLTFTFRTRIWRPQNWTIKRFYKGEFEIVPTVVLPGQARPNSCYGDRSEDSPLYMVEKDEAVTTSTRFPFWRWTNFCCRTWAWTWNMILLTLIVIPWCSSYSLRALFCLHPFYPEHEVCQLNGHLYQKSSSMRETLVSRLRGLWRHVSKSRTNFEALPDRGLLGKSFLRHLNRLNNYIIKGVGGTLLLITLFPTGCILVSGVSLCIGLVCPVLVPVTSLLLHLTGLLIYDFETLSLPAALIPNILFNFILLGVAQPVLALLVSVVLCPLAACLISLFALLRKGCRQFWDTAMFQLVIKKRARVPAGDSFVARRIAGPGLASNYFYQIKTEQALVSLEAKMEAEELEAYLEEMSGVISSPVEDYKRFISDTLRILSLSVNKQVSGPYHQLDKETSDHLTRLREKVEKRQRQLVLVLPEDTRSRIKLTERELKLALSRGAAMVQSFYPTHVIARRRGGSAQFWDQRGLREEDWVGLVSSLYTEIFSAEFLTPLQETDTTFHLKVEHWNLTRYLNMVLESDWHDDMGVARAVHTPKQNIHIKTPSLDVELFNPLSGTGSSAHLTSSSGSTRTSWRIFPRKAGSLVAKLCVPLPVPHPAEVSLILYNRDSETPIKLEDCRAALRELRDLPQPLSVEYLTLSSQSPQDQQRDHRQREVEEEERSSRSQDSMYEMGPEMDSLTHSLEHLDSQVSLVKNCERSKSIVDSSPALHHTRTDMCKVRAGGQVSRSQANVSYSVIQDYQRTASRSIASLGSARMASVEDMRIEGTIREVRHTAV